MSKEYNYEIGYETLQSEWKMQCKRTPRGVTLVKGGNNIYLQFKTPNTTRSKYKCACSFTIDGMHEAVRKSHLVKAKLTSMTSEVEFWDWYKKEVENESQLVDDRITFGEAIEKVENAFWNRLDSRKQPRIKGNPSHEDSWYRAYGCFYKHLPLDECMSLQKILDVVRMQKQGSSNLKEVVRAMKKLCELSKRTDFIEELKDIDTTQTIFAKLQSIDLDKYLAWRDEVLGFTKELPPNADLVSRKAWLWVFSTQITYALRISEVFAIKNLFKSYTTEDGETIPALNSLGNTSNLLYIGKKTILGTTVKTGDRLARPQVPPSHPNLIEQLKIKFPIVPENRPTTKNHGSVRRFFAKTAREQLIAWNAPFTQTHADRNLGNINGMQAGIPQEVRAMSMGHTVQMNEYGYKKRAGTKTKIDLLLNSNTNAIDFVTALAEAKKLVKEKPGDKGAIVKLLSIIYQKDSKNISELL